MWARTRSRCRISVFASLAVALTAFCSARCSAQPAPATSYYEFGTVVALGRQPFGIQTVDIQTFDPQRQRLVQHSFVLGRETRADVVRVGDSVEVVFLANGTDWTLKRLIVLASGIPLAGPPPSAPTKSEPAGATLNPAPAAAVPAVTLQPVFSKPAPMVAAAAPAPSIVDAPLPAAKVKTTKKTPKVKPVPLPAPVRPAIPAPATASLVATGAPKSVPGAVPVQLGASAEATKNLTPRSSKDVAIDRPSEECNRSSADWPTQPLRLAVLDFRYPTEREEAHDIGTTGGGSGTAVADLVFARLEQLEQRDDRYAFSRGDRRRLDRTDFAGAARLGRQLGVDAVLAGTFVPVVSAAQGLDDPTPPKTYELRAGIVDTCTGQLLLQTSTVSCPGAFEPGLTTGADPATCTRLATSAAETADPKYHAAAFRPLLDDLLYPLEHPNPSAQADSIGKVIATQGADLTVQLAPHAGLRAGDLVGIHASRLTKNPTTYTLRNLQDEEIGRMTIRDLQGSTARGTYAGDYPPRPGDVVEPIAR